MTRRGFKGEGEGGLWRGGGREGCGEGCEEGEGGEGCVLDGRGGYRHGII